MKVFIIFIALAGLSMLPSAFSQATPSSVITSCSGVSVHCSRPQGGYSVVQGLSSLNTSQNTYTAFSEHFNDTRNFNGKYVTEIPGNTNGTNSCYWSGSSLTQHPQISGGEWLVGGAYNNPVGNGYPAPQNAWGYDYVGIDSDTIDYIRANGPAHGIQFPCSYVIYQDMVIYACDNGGSTIYEFDNLLAYNIDVHNVINSRQGVGSYIAY